MERCTEVNCCKPRDDRQAKEIDRPAPKGTWLGTETAEIFCRGCGTTGVQVAPSPRRSNLSERGKLVVFLKVFLGGTLTARKADDIAGKRQWKKRKPVTNRTDRS